MTSEPLPSLEPLPGVVCDVQSNSDPLNVTVLIAAKNAAATIGRAVASALAQPDARQVLVVDDGSTDDTAAAALAAGDGSSHLDIIRLPENLGPAGARNVGLERANGDFVAVLDADDFMLPGRLAAMRPWVEGVDLLYDDLCLSDERAPLAIEGRLLGLQEGFSGDLTLSDFAEGNISRPGRPRREMGFMKPLMRRDFLLAQALRYDPGLRLGEDYVLYATALARGASARLIAATGYVAVRRGDSLSGQHNADDVRRLYAACLGLAESMAPKAEGRAEVLEHVTSLRRRVTHLDALAARKANGLTGAVSVLAQRLPDVPYVLAQTLRDKVATKRPMR